MQSHAAAEQSCLPVCAVVWVSPADVFNTDAAQNSVLPHKIKALLSYFL